MSGEEVEVAVGGVRRSTTGSCKERITLNNAPPYVGIHVCRYCISTKIAGGNIIWQI